MDHVAAGEWCKVRHLSMGDLLRRGDAVQPQLVRVVDVAWVPLTEAVKQIFAGAEHRHDPSGSW